LDFETPRIILLDNQKKLAQKVIQFMNTQPLELWSVPNIRKLEASFEEQNYDMLMLFEDEAPNKINETLAALRKDNPTLLICLIGESAQTPAIEHDFYLCKAELKSEEVMSSCMGNIIKIIVRQKNQVELSAMLLHDLRSPTQSIIGYLELLEKGIFGEINDGQRQILRNSLQLSEILVDLLEELGQVFQYESKKFELKKAEIHLKELIDDTLRSLWVQADKKNIKFVPHVSQKLPTIVADRTALQRVLINLLTNAITYCPENGTVRIYAQETDSSTKQEMVHFRIIDTGPGIPAEDVDFLFSKYFRVRKAKQKSKGFGLGLYLSKLIVNAHGGQIGAYNNREGGSTFYFKLPYKSE
jgi:signal transduction histidine kinase